MGFKLPGKSIQSGTAGHSSALKMRASENAASAFKQKNPKAKTYDEAYDAMGEVKSLTKGSKAVYKDNILDNKYYTDKDSEGKATESGRKDFTKAAEDWNMKTYGTKNPTSVANKGGMTKKELAAKYKASTTTTKKTTPKVEKSNAEVKKAQLTNTTKAKNKKIVANAENKAKKDDKGDFKVDYKAERKLVRSEQKLSRKKARIDVKEARKTSGRGSDEVKAAKEARKTNRKANRAERKQMRVDQKENKKEETPAKKYKK